MHFAFLSAVSSARAFPPLSVGVTAAAGRAAADRGVSSVARSPRGFLPAYRRAGGKLAAMGTAPGWERPWSAVRLAFLARHEAQRRQGREPLWEPSGRPTRRALALAVWAWHPEPAALARWLRAQGYLP